MCAIRCLQFAKLNAFMSRVTDDQRLPSMLQSGPPTLTPSTVYLALTCTVRSLVQFGRRHFFIFFNNLGQCLLFSDDIHRLICAAPWILISSIINPIEMFHFALQFSYLRLSIARVLSEFTSVSSALGAPPRFEDVYRLYSISEIHHFVFGRPRPRQFLQIFHEMTTFPCALPGNNVSSRSTSLSRH